ncbi:hypothetical protein [Actinoalloteichus caeruleus]|uniref:hypothetical protein n=1 Tax=Actinoalloteichus cyanogriseus TaxID=2893586 RepID=UPI003AAC1002
MINNEKRFAYLAEGNARQARKRVAVDLLIRDDDGRTLPMASSVTHPFARLRGATPTENHKMVTR